MYAVSITYYPGSQREFSYDETLPTLEAAVDQIQYWAKGGYRCRAWINNKEVRMLNGYVVDDSGAAFCTNPVWHEVFAKPLERVSLLTETQLLQRMHDDMRRMFRPQPTRGSAPQNPATLAERGDL